MSSLNFFSQLFGGLKSAYGTYELNGARRSDGKAEGKALTKKGEVTSELFQKHLNGELSLGIVPIMEDNNCKWGCIDVDEYAGFNPCFVYTSDASDELRWLDLGGPRYIKKKKSLTYV